MVVAAEDDAAVLQSARFGRLGLGGRAVVLVLTGPHRHILERCAA